MIVLIFFLSFLVLTSFYLHTVGVEVIQICIDVFSQSDAFWNVCCLATSFDPDSGLSSGHYTRKWMHTETKYHKVGYLPFLH